MKPIVKKEAVYSVLLMRDDSGVRRFRIRAFVRISLDGDNMPSYSDSVCVIVNLLSDSCQLNSKSYRPVPSGRTPEPKPVPSSLKFSR